MLQHVTAQSGGTFAATPPPGFQPNPDEPVQASSLIVVVAVTLPLAIITVTVRLYTRVFLVQRLALDDYLMLAATALSIVLDALSMNMLSHGLGRHLWNVRMEDLYPAWLLERFVASMVYCAATGLAKGSIQLFYLRIFPTRAMQWAIWITFAFTIAFSLAGVLVNVFTCDPIDGTWNLEASVGARCIDQTAFYFAQAALGIVADLAVVIVPLPALKSLQLPRGKKISVAALLSIGAFVCVVSIVRLKSIYNLQKDPDVTCELWPLAMFAYLQLGYSQP